MKAIADLVGICLCVLYNDVQVLQVNITPVFCSAKSYQLK